MKMTIDIGGTHVKLESKSEPKLGHDSSTNNLIRRDRKQR
jgi:hypothetical protein